MSQGLSNVVPMNKAFEKTAIEKTDRAKAGSAETYDAETYDAEAYDAEADTAVASGSGTGSRAGSDGGALACEQRVGDIVALIARAPWREAVTYRDSWPHEYVVVKKDGQEELLKAFCARVSAGEGVECRFFNQKREYLFVGAHKYWTMTDCADIDLEVDDYVLNRALLYRDRRDFVIKPGDVGTTRRQDSHA